MLPPYQKQIEEAIVSSVQTFEILEDAASHSLLSGGKRFRPAIVLMIAKGIGKGFDVKEAALAVEFFHTASLIADDLPCMDDEFERRGKPALHQVYGEAKALLVSYGLIAAGYEYLAKNGETIRPMCEEVDFIVGQALRLAAQTTGFSGATGGQVLDLFPEDVNQKTLEKVITMKTGALFEISFVLGWLFGGGDLSYLQSIREIGRHFGKAFQIVDDLEDQEKDHAIGRRVNVANALGKEIAVKMFHLEMEQFFTKLEELPADFIEIEAIAEALFEGVTPHFSHK